MPPSAWLFWLAGLLILAVIFPIVISFLAPFSGWERLANRYPLTGAFPKGGHRFQSMWLNNIAYRRVLRMVETPEGVYIVPMSLFRLNHPPLFIPWHAIQVEEHPTWWGWYRGHIQSTPREEFHIPAGVKKRWASFLKNASSLPLEPKVP
ncbi:MAG TPA: hypothetical protein ENJ54_01570 [Chloroflexi bacterium]|nr:hypothetical protein [Chloroflexota bacterium]